MPKRRKILIGMASLTAFLLVGFISCGIYSGKLSSSAWGGTPYPAHTNDTGPGSLQVNVTCKAPCDQFGFNKITYTLQYTPQGFGGYNDPTHYSKGVTIDGAQYTFINLPLGHYTLTVSRNCPPGDNLGPGNCYRKQTVDISGGNSQEIDLSPQYGSLAINLRHLEEKSYPGIQSDCHQNSDGFWDCPIAAELTCTSSLNTVAPVINKVTATHYLKRSLSAGDTITCSAVAGNLRADNQSISIQGCIQDKLSLYLD